MSIKIQFGSGQNRLKGWYNHDRDMDIAKPLPLENNFADFVFAERVVDNLTPEESFNFFEESYRIMKPGAVIRIVVPSMMKVMEKMTPEYRKFIQNQGWSDGTSKGAIKAIIFRHQSVWTVELLKTYMSAVGFVMVDEASINASKYPELKGIDGHAKEIGESFNAIESIVVEGMKP